VLYGFKLCVSEEGRFVYRMLGMFDERSEGAFRVLFNEKEHKSMLLKTRGNTQ
jgi:hypothetical protein